MKILISDNFSARGVEVLHRYEQFQVDQNVGLKPDQLKDIIGDYDALIVRSETRVTADIINAATKLKVIGRAGSGVDNIDVPAATKRGIVVMNAAAGNSVTTGEHTLAMMMALARKIPQAHASMKSGKWEKKKFMGVELRGKMLGIVGFGNIGKIVAQGANGLGMKVLAYDPFLSKDVAAHAGVELVPFDDLIARADFITVHTPLTEETRGIIGEAAIAKMKDGVRIINCARGGLVDEAALFNAIKSGKVAAAALDVFSQEPPPPDFPLLSLDEVIVAPHLGASTNEAQDQVAIITAEQIAAFLTTGAISGAVNMAAVTPEVLTVLQPYLTLGEKLGRFQSQLDVQSVHEVEIKYRGEVADLDVRPITSSILAALLAQVSENVNQVNAAMVAESRGLKVKESLARSASENSIEVTLRGDSGESQVTGALFGPDDARIVNLNSYRLEAVPAGHLLVISNEDVPGMIGHVGSFLGNHGVNIAQLYLSRNRKGGVALSIYQLDHELDDAALQALASDTNIRSVKQINL
ncbi:MAG TPA: phosphoglycerate dehydrogenase [Blastocatellia bacterium]|nr:phosphoglycerate dehydrogenase [Blastocatellia bacterium]